MSFDASLDRPRPTCQADRDALVLASKPLARIVAKRMSGALLGYADAFQEATIGIIRASRDYDPDQGAWRPWALKHARWAVIEALRLSHTVVLPDSAQRAGVSPPRYVLATDIPDELDSATASLEARDTMARTVSARELHILELKREGYTLEEIGQLEGGVTRQCIGQIYVRAIRKLTHAVT